LPNAKRIAKGSTSTFRDQNVERNDEEPFFRIAIRARSSETVVRFRSMPFFTVDVKTAPPTSGAGPLKPKPQGLRGSGEGRGRRRSSRAGLCQMGRRGHLSAASHSRPASQVSPSRPPAGRVPNAKSSTHTGGERRDRSHHGGVRLGTRECQRRGAGKKKRNNLCAGVSSVRPCQPHDDELDRAGPGQLAPAPRGFANVL